MCFGCFVNPHDQRLYDDAIWVGIDLADLYSKTKDSWYLDYAKSVWNFVLSGKDDELGGGVYWDENAKDSKNTCSNAPAVVLALKLYQITNDAAYLENLPSNIARMPCRLSRPIPCASSATVSSSPCIIRSGWRSIRSTTRLSKTLGRASARRQCTSRGSNADKGTGPAVRQLLQGYGRRRPADSGGHHTNLLPI